jgi:hypothetical protein
LKRCCIFLLSDEIEIFFIHLAKHCSKIKQASSICVIIFLI